MLMRPTDLDHDISYVSRERPLSRKATGRVSAVTTGPFTPTRIHEKRLRRFPKTDTTNARTYRHGCTVSERLRDDLRSGW